jgi:hypothetical protein
MGSVGEDSAFFLANNIWLEQKPSSPKKNTALELTFMAYELEEVLLSMKVGSCLGQDGLPILFFKKFWGIPIGTIISLLWRVDVARLNFEILTLTPIYDQGCRLYQTVSPDCSY